MFVEDFLGQKLVGIGWREVGSIGAETPDDEIQRRFVAAYPDWKDGSRRSGAAQVIRLLKVRFFPRPPPETYEMSPVLAAIALLGGHARVHAEPRHSQI